MWSETVGHEPQRRMILRALARGVLPHALLLTGEEGIGKRRLAEWIVAASWCREPERPCGDCASCRQVITGNHPDLQCVERGQALEEGQGSPHEITVGQVREGVVDFLSRRAVASAGRSVIIDRAEDLNDEAQNALLKSLEEPPAEARLLLVTAHEDALLDTILSRCQQMRLSPLMPSEMRLLSAGHSSEMLSAARGRPGMLPRLESLECARLGSAAEQLLGGQLKAAAFAREAQALCADEGSDSHRLALNVLHGWLADRELPDLQPALLEALQDLQRHVPPAVVWLQLGLEWARLGGRPVGVLNP